MRKPVAPKVAGASSSLGTPTSSSAGKRHVCQTATAKPRLTPKLRFPEFRDGEGWEDVPLRQVADINPSADDLPESFIYIDLESVEAGALKARNRISRQGAPSRAQRLLRNGDVVFQMVRPYQRNNLFCVCEGAENYVASTGYAQLRARQSDRFLYHAVHNDTFVSAVMAKCTGSNYPAINSADLAEINLAVPPSLPEQQQIASCLTSLDDLIAAESQKLNTLKTHKKGLMQQLFPRVEGASSSRSGIREQDAPATVETRPRLRFPEFRKAGEWREKKLGDVVNSFKTGKLDANAMVENGQYRFYTCAKTYYRIDNYAFEGEALLVAGNGAHLGYIHHYIGKFNAYQRTYVLQKFKANVVFLRCLLDRHLPSRILLEKKDGNTPYIVLSTLTEMPLLIPHDTDEQRRIAACLSSLDDLIAAQADKLEALKTHKRGLMQQLFPASEEVRT